MHSNNTISPHVSEEVADASLLRTHSPVSRVADFDHENSDLGSGRISHGSSHEVHKFEGLAHSEVRLRRHLGWFCLWTWELFAIAISASALISIAAVLIAYNGKTLAEWGAPIRPNTVISALSTLAKSSMLMVVGEGLGQLKWTYFEQRPHRLQDFEIFDGASRGPLGSLRLLWKINRRAFMASMGAIIVLFALAMDPFVQQVISYPQKYVNATDERARIGANRFFSSKYATAAFDNVEMAAAINTAVFAAPRQAKFECSSGRCDWEQFTTLGVCSSCQDITESIRSTRQCTDDRAVGLTPSSSGYPLSICTWDVQPGWSIKGASDCFTSESGRPMKSNIRFNATVYKPGYSTPTHVIAYIAALKFNEDAHIDDEHHCRFTLKEAQKCSLTWCQKTYNTTRVENSTLTDRLAFHEELKLLTTGGAMKSDNCSAPGYFPTKVMDMSHFDALFVRSSYDLEGEHCPTPQDYHGAFLVNSVSKDYAQDRIESVFNTSAGATYDIAPINNVAEWFLRADSVASVMEDVATSMTNVIRNANETAVVGTSKQREVFIKVHWPWMALPASLVLLSICFLAASMTFATEKSQAVWKTSSLATLFHGLQGWADADIRNMRLNDINCSAKNMWACLREDEKGNWKLIKQG